MGELCENRSVELKRAIDHEGRDLRLHAAAEFLEGKVLILHLGGEFRRLEQTLTIPHQIVDGGNASEACCVDRFPQPLVDEGQFTAVDDGLLHLGDLAVVFGMKDVVHGGQAKVFVATPVTRDEVAIQQFVVVGCVLAELVGNDGIAGLSIGIGLFDSRLSGDPIHDIGARSCVMGDVVKEGMAVAHCLACIDRVGQIALDKQELGLGRVGRKVRVGHHELRHAVRTGDEVAVDVSREQRAIGHIAVIQLDAQQVGSLCLDVAPSGHATAVAMQQVAVGNRAAVGVQLVFTQEHLMRGMRGIGLVLVDPRRRLVEVIPHVVSGAQNTVRAGLVGGAGQHHEVGWRAFDIERVIGHQRDIDGAASAFADKVETVVEELTKQGHPRVVGSRQTFVGCHINDPQVVAIHFDTMGGQQGVERGLSFGSCQLCGREGCFGGAGCVESDKGVIRLAKRRFQRGNVCFGSCQIRRCSDSGTQGGVQGNRSRRDLSQGNRNFSAGRLSGIKCALRLGFDTLCGGHIALGRCGRVAKTGHFAVRSGQRRI